ncbi:autophagy-related protein 41 [Monosporozyma unispora]|nr:hypothetical protein C6P44_003745 [Kazachstania unispora]
MSYNNSYYPQEEDLFSLTFTQNNSIPILSHSSNSSIGDSPLSSYQDDLLLNTYNVDNNNNNNITSKQSSYTPIQINDSNDLIFELDNEYISTIKQQSEKKQQTFNVNTKPIQDNFANVAQQNYRLWLNSV